MQPFRPSLRDAVTRLTVLAATSWLVLRLGLQADVRVATVMTVGALAVMFATRIGFRGAQTELTPDDDGLRVRGPEGDRSIPWRTMESVRLASGDVTTAKGIVRVCYAHVELAHGPPLAFADLSSLGGPRLRTAEGDAPVYDVADPELLLGTIAERLDAPEFLPRPDTTPEPAARGPWLAASPLTTLRLGVAVLLGARVAGALAGDADALMAALAGATAVASTHALVRFLAQRDGGLSQSEVGAPPALAVGALVAMAAALPLRGIVPPVAGAWALVTALALALPAWPLPAGYAARRLGRALTETGDTVVAVAVGALGVIAAWLYARGLVVIPTALVAGGMEAAEGFAASRRHARLAALPRFRSLAPEAIASFRALLRPLRPNEDDATLGPADVLDLRSASAPPPPRSVLALVVAGAALTLAALAARSVLHGPDSAAARAIRLLVS